MATKQALFILTECGIIPSGNKAGKPTGAYASEIAHPFHVLTEAGFNVTFATPNGQPAPIDKASVPLITDSMTREFLKHHAKDEHIQCVKLSGLKQDDFDVVFFPGGHGPMFDLARDTAMGQWVARFWEHRNGVLGAVCHGPAAFVTITLSDGTPLVKGQSVSGFTNAEEKESGMADSMPFLLETRLRELGANVLTTEPWKEIVTVSGRLVTGQNPASATGVGKAMVQAAQSANFK